VLLANAFNKVTVCTGADAGCAIGHKAPNMPRSSTEGAGGVEEVNLGGVSGKGHVPL